MTQSSSLTLGHVLFPVSLVAFTLFLAFGYVGTQVIKEREFLNASKTSQDQYLEQASKVKGQLEALAQGTIKLAGEGNKNAQVMVDRMKQAGLLGEPAAQASAPASTNPSPAVKTE